MADQEIINVLLKLENPQVLDRVEKLKSEQFQIKFSGSLDQGVKDILAIKDRKISITADVQGAMNSLKGIETTLKSLQNLKEIKLNLTGNLSADLEKVSNEMNRLLLQAQKINTVGISNQKVSEYANNPNLGQATASLAAQSSISQKQLEDSFLVTNFNQIKAKREAAQAAQRQVFLQQIAAEEAQRNRDAGATNRILQLDPFQKAQQTSLSAANPLIAQAQAEDAARAERDRRLVQNFNAAKASFTVNNAEVANAARVKALDPFQGGSTRDLDSAKALIARANQQDARKAQIEAQQDFERAQELANAQLREEGIAKFRASIGTVPQGKFSAIDANAKRVEQLRELGQSAALGALQGQGLLSVGGSLLGSLAGAAVPGGAAFGGLVGGALGASAERTIESITRALEKAAEAGLSFETSILGISSVLQATTRVSGPGGEALGLGDQLSFQQGQARSIQKLARTKLLPLGISGDKESTLVQSIISGAAQRGIQLTPEQAATLAERLGGAIQSQRPELLGNSGQLRRDVEDLFSGAPQNTVLKTLTKGFAPGLGKATSAEDLIKRSEGLASFPETLRNSTTNPVVAAQKLNSAVDNLNTTVGDAYVTALIPATNALAKSLADPRLLDGAEKLGAALGAVGGYLTDVASRTIDTVTFFEKALQDVPGAAGDLAGVGIRRAIGRGSSAENDLLELQAKKRGGFFTDQREIDAQIAAAQKEFDKENIKNKVTPKASVELAKALRGSGIDDLNTSASPDLKSGAAILVSLQEARKQIQNEFKEGLDEARANNKNPTNTFNQIDLDARRRDLNSNRITQELGLSLERASALRKDSADRQSLFDTSSPLGQVNKLTDSLKDLSTVREELEETVRLAKFKKSELGKDALPEDVKKANEVVRVSTQELIKARNDEREAIDKLKTAELDRAKVLRDSQFDPGTIQGRSGLIQSGLQDANGRISKASAELAALQERLVNATDDTDKKNIQSKIEKATLEFNRGQIGRAELSRQAQNNAIDLAQGPEEAKKALSDFARATEAAADKFDALGDQLVKAKLDLSDFDASKRLRALGREGAIIDAAERAVAAGGGADSLNSLSADVKIPAGLSQLVKGSRDFDPDARARFEIERANENFDEVLRTNGGGRGILDDQQRRAELERKIRQNKRDIEAAPFEDKQRQFAGLRQLVGLQQQGVDIGSEGTDFIKKQAKELGIDLPKLEKAETLSVSLPQNVSSINENVKQILQLMSGSTGGVLSPPSGGTAGAGNLSTGFEGRDKDLLKILIANGVSVKTDDFGPKRKYGDPNGKYGEFDETTLAGLYTPSKKEIDIYSRKKGLKNFDPRKEEDETLDHEALHALDDLLGNPSESKEFKKIYEEATKGLKKGEKPSYGYQNPAEFFAEIGNDLLNNTGDVKETSPGSLDPAKEFISKILNTPDFGVGESLKKIKKTSNPLKDIKDLFFDSAPLFTDDSEELKQITSGINDNPINFSDSLIARPSVPSRAYNPILREGLNEGLGNKADAKTNAVLEDVVGGFLDADVEGLKKQNRAPASGLKNGLFSGGLFGDREDVRSGKGTAESNFADSVGAKIDENFNKLGDIISKALGGAL